MDLPTFELQFAKLIERFHEQIREDFIEDTVQKRGILSQYEIGREMLVELADNILAEFTKNIDKKTTRESIADKYAKMGIRCYDAGLGYAAMVRVFILLKRHIWLFFQDSNFAGQPFDVRSIVALSNRTALFFDRVIYYFLVGYEQASSDEKTELEGLYETFLAKIRRDLQKP